MPGVRKSPRRAAQGKYVINVVFTGSREESEQLLRQARRRIFEVLAPKLRKQRDGEEC